MWVVNQVVLSDELREEFFACNLAACKGACCVEGDAGAPLEVEELPLLDEIYPRVKQYLTQEGLEALQQQGHYVQEEDGSYTTPLTYPGGPCAYLTYENGIALCGIEKAFLAGAINFRKPISCHLYPIRVHRQGAFEFLRYDRWEICNPACAKGARLQLPVFRFVKEALIRKYGAEFYAQLEALAQQQPPNQE